MIMALPKGPLLAEGVGGMGLHWSRGLSCVSLCLLASQGAQKGLFSG